MDDVGSNGSPLPGTEPGKRRLALPLGVVVTVAAAVLAALASWASPSPWAQGEGALRVAAGERVLVELPVRIGATETVTAARAGLEIEAPDGIPVAAPVMVEVRSAGEPVPEDLRVEVVLAGGTVEEVPVLSRTDDSASALRRPPQDVGIVLALLAVVVLLWVSELVPLHVTSLLIPVVLAVAGVRDAGPALAPFFDPIIVLFFAGFLMAKAMARVGLDHLVAAHVVARAGASPRRLFATMLVITAGASMWMSNTAAVALLVPIALTITAPLNSRGYQKVLVIGIAYAATIGGVGSAIGTPANQLAIRFLDTFADRQVTFVEWFGFGLPMVVLFLPLMGAYLWVRLRPEVDLDTFRVARVAAGDEVRAAGRLRGPQIRVAAVLVAVLAGWLTQTWHDVVPGIVALAGAIVLMVTRDVTNDDLGTISWPTLLTFGGGLTLGLALVDSGTSDWLVTRLAGVEAWPDLAAVAAIAGASLVLTTVASNTAAAATLIPLAIPLAGLVGVDPVLVTVVVAIASSIDFALVIGTPPTMLAHSTGLFTAREILGLGSVLDLAGLVLLVGAVTAVWSALGLL